MKAFMNQIAPFLVLILVACNSQTNSENSEKFDAIEKHSLTLLTVLDSIDQDIKHGKYGLIDRLMVIQNGQTLVDNKYQQEYESIFLNYDTTEHQFNYDHPKWHPFYSDTELHTLQSVTKSVNSILLGIALDSYSEFETETKIIPLFSEYSIENLDTRKEQITIGDLLTMRSGLQWSEGNYLDSADDCNVMELSEDWISYVLNKPMDSNPGETFEYNSGVSVLLGKILRIITGKRADQWAEEKLFGPLGITEYYWKQTPLGEIDTEGGLYLKAEDLVKIGILFQNKGKWNNKQIVPAEWVAASISPQVKDLYPEERDNIGYGYQWWVEDYEKNETKIYSMNGFGGQFLMVAQEYNLMVIFNGWNIHEEPELYSYDALMERILPVLK